MITTQILITDINQQALIHRIRSNCIYSNDYTILEILFQ